MKLNNKGFTVVELLTSFTLTMIIVVFLFQIVLELKDVYVNDTLEAKIVEKNAVIATTLNNKLKDKIIIEDSDNALYNSDPSTPKILCAAKYDTGNGLTDFIIKAGNNGKSIVIKDGTGEQTISMPADTKVAADCRFEQVYLDNTKDNAFLKLSYVVSSDLLDKDVTFNYVYSYHQGYPQTPDTPATS